VVNLLEYVLGTSPAASSQMPVAMLNAANRVQFSFDRPTGRDDVTIFGECSTDLINWTADANLVETIAFDLGGGMERIIVRQSENAPATTKCFLRLTALQP
jgi:hypothetical protein